MSVGHDHGAAGWSFGLMCVLDIEGYQVASTYEKKDKQGTGAKQRCG